MKQINYKKLILPNIPYVFFVYLFDKVGQAVRLAPGADISAKILNITQGFSAAFENALPSVYPLDLLVGIVGAVIIRLIVYVKGKNAKKYRKGAEYGSARWGNAEDIKPYIDPDFQNNIILTQTERLTMNSRPKQPKYARNKNVVVIGGSGSGKTRFFVKPNLMQLHSSYVLTDPKGTVLIECGKLLQRAGYRIKVLNTINFKKSMHYNPFVYIRSEKDILKLVNTLIANTKGEGEKSAEDFWVKAERLLYCALVGYIWYEAPAEEMNFITLLELINASEAREDDEEYQSPVDLLFADLEERDPDHFAVKQYRKYKLAAGVAAHHQHMGSPQQVTAHINAAFVFLGNGIVEEQRQVKGRADGGKSRLIHSTAILRRPFCIFAVAAVPCGGDVRKGSFHSQYLRYFHNVVSTQSPRPFPFMGKGAALEDMPPSRRFWVAQPGQAVKGRPPQAAGHTPP